MAFPVTVSTDSFASRGIAGPYVSSGGNVYIVFASSNRLNLRALKATDPSTSFAGVGTDVVIGAGSDVIWAIAGQQLGDNIHVLTRNSIDAGSVDIRYHVFSMASDSWTTTNEMVVTNATFATGGPAIYTNVGIAVRSSGTVLACYNGSAETVSTVLYDRVYYARRVAGVWTADIPIGNAGVAANWIGGAAILNAGNRVNFFFQDASNGRTYQRTLDSANALEALPAAFDSTTEAWESHEQRGVWNTAMSIVSFPWYSANNQIDRAVVSAQDVPSLSLGANITGATLVLTAPYRYVASHAVDSTTIWNAFIDTASDIYLNSNENGAGWSTPFLFLTTSASSIYTNVYTRSNALVLGMVFVDVNPKYHEYTLSTMGVPSIGLPNSLMLGRVGT